MGASWDRTTRVPERNSDGQSHRGGLSASRNEPLRTDRGGGQAGQAASGRGGGVDRHLPAQGQAYGGRPAGDRPGDGAGHALAPGGGILRLNDIVELVQATSAKAD